MYIILTIALLALVGFIIYKYFDNSPLDNNFYGGFPVGEDNVRFLKEKDEQKRKAAEERKRNRRRFDD